ncbi:MAG: YfhO family protein [Tepidisphaerales bacterium]
MPDAPPTPSPILPNRSALDHPLLGLGLLAAVVLVLFSPVLFGPADRVISAPGSDVVSQFLGWREYGFERLADGDVPLWNPYLFSGQSFIGNWQTAMFYPPNALHLMLPAPRAINLLVAAHVYLAGVLTWLWLSQKGYRSWSATVAAGVFMLSAPLLGRIFAGHLTWVAAVAWMPLVMLCIDRLLDGGRWVWAWLGSAALAMQLLAGYPQPVYLTLLAASAYLVLCGVFSPHRWRAVVGFFVLMTVGVALAAVQVLPGVQTGLESSRAGGATFEYASSFALPLENLALLVAPLALGGPSTSSYGGAWFLWEVWPYFGAVGLGVALLGGVLDRGERRRWAGTMAVLAVLLALGPATPLYRLAYEAVPGLASFRVPGRFLVIAALFGAVLVASGVEVLRGRGRGLVGVTAELTRVALASLAVGAAALLVYLAWTAGSDMTGPGPLRSPAMYASAALLLAAGLLLLALRTRGATWALGLLGAGELLVVARVCLAYGPAYPPVPPAYEALFRQMDADTRVQIQDIAMANLPLRLRLTGGGLTGYDPLQSRRFAAFMAATQGKDPREVTEIVGPLRAHPAWRLLRAGWIISENGVVGRFDDPLPRAMLVDRAEVVPNEPLQLARLLDERFDPFAAVLVDAPPPWPREDVSRAADAVDFERRGDVTVLEHSGDVLRLQVDAPRLSILLVTDSYASGWQAVREDTGSVYPVFPANFALQGVAVPPGRYVLKLEYRPWGWTWGRWVSLAGLAGWAAWGVWLAWRSRGSRNVR